ncbi:hypothetical protein Hanom_Chr08g00697911 [Helianthus anomalus]
MTALQFPFNPFQASPVFLPSLFSLHRLPLIHTHTHTRIIFSIIFLG